MIITRFHRFAVLLVLTAASVAAGCGGQSSPAAPSEPSTSSAPGAPPSGGTTTTGGLTGLWAGTAIDNSGPGAMEWSLTESNGSVSGSVTLVDFTAGVKGTGSMSGTLSGATVTFTLTVPAGGFDGPFAGCSAAMTGQATLTDATLTVSYSGTNSCSGAVATGTATLSKS